MKTRYLSHINLYFALFIVLWGAWVRLSGSGAGCGEHWPLCNGEVVPIDAGIKTFIEFTHRLTSGIFGFTILGMVFYARKEFERGHPLRFYALWSLALTIVEALIGAVLVKKGLVDQNSSHLRAVVIALHLGNTLLLMASLSACVFFAKAKSFTFTELAQGMKRFFAVVAVLIFIVVSSGAVTALGNTLFPESSLLAGMDKDFSKDSPFLIRLRIYHPISALIMASLFMTLNSKMRSLVMGQRLCDFNQAIIIISLAFGAINWLLMAPTWGALLHLLLANIMWLGFLELWWESRYQPVKG